MAGRLDHKRSVWIGGWRPAGLRPLTGGRLGSCHPGREGTCAMEVSSPRHLPPPTPPDPPAPPLANRPPTLAAHPLLPGEHGAVASTNYMATRAGLEALAAGGTAADAAAAVQFMLGVTQPESNGIGGGGSDLSAHTAAWESRALPCARQGTPCWARCCCYPSLFVSVSVSISVVLTDVGASPRCQHTQARSSWCTTPPPRRS